MTSFATPWAPCKRARPRRASRSRTRARPSRFVLTLALPVLALLLAAGCVTRGTYEEVVEERDQLALEKRVLEEQLRRLEASRESLTAERVRLIDQLEDLRQEHETLTEDLERLRRAREELSQSLAKRERELSQVQGTYEALVSDLESEVAAGQIEIEQLREGLRVGVADEILFPSGSAELNPQGRDVLRRVASQLGSLPHRIEVEGHTDDVPIRGALQKRYPTNWELAGARAARVVRLFEEAGLDPERLVAVSYAEHHPVAPNDTPAHRSQNRRIEIRLVPREDREAGASSAGSAGGTPPVASEPESEGGAPAEGESEGAVSAEAESEG